MEVFEIERENMITVKYEKDCQKKPIKVSELPEGTTFRAKWLGSKLTLFIRARVGKEVASFCMEAWPMVSSTPFSTSQPGDLFGQR